MTFLQFIFSNAWIYFGFALLLGMILNFLLSLWNGFWKYRNIRKHGYPPEYCNADGEFRKTNEISDNNT